MTAVSYAVPYAVCYARGNERRQEGAGFFFPLGCPWRSLVWVGAPLWSTGDVGRNGRRDGAQRTELAQKAAPPPPVLRACTLSPTAVTRSPMLGTSGLNRCRQTSAPLGAELGDARQNWGSTQELGRNAGPRAPAHSCCIRSPGGDPAVCVLTSLQGTPRGGIPGRAPALAPSSHRQPADTGHSPGGPHPTLPAARLQLPPCHPCSPHSAAPFTPFHCCFPPPLTSRPLNGIHCSEL